LVQLWPAEGPGLPWMAYVFPSIYAACSSVAASPLYSRNAFAFIFSQQLEARSL